jgi:hypothetical protein
MTEIERRIELDQGAQLSTPQAGRADISVTRATFAAVWRQPYRKRLMVLIV